MNIYIVNQRGNVLYRLPDGIPPTKGSTIKFPNERTVDVVDVKPLTLEKEVMGVMYDYVHNSIHIKVHTDEKDIPKL